ncbi:MAG TPA: hypothetical protein VIG25_00740 [Pyrinomonadaceae bacterium]
MKRILAMLGAISVLATLLVSVVAFAQDPQPSSGSGIVIQRRVTQGPEGPPPPPGAPGNTFVFVASEMGFGGKVVKGAPYSAEATTETIQTLADGNRIVNNMSSTLYRDSEGRTRREQTLKAIGPFANDGEPIQTIFISDPVAGVTYALDSSTHTAHKSMPLKLEQGFGTSVAPAGPGAPRWEYKGEPKFELKLETKRMVKPEGPPPAPALAPEQMVVKTEGGPGVSYVFKHLAEDVKNQVKESLGTQIIEGVQAEGTRVTVRIPAGEIGNERPIEIVTERWYSPELKMVVMSKHSDPRSGETTYRLTNINRAEPAKSLFEVPAGYTISEGFGWKQAPLPAKVRKPGNPE